MAVVFTMLCGFQLVIGLLMFTFGSIDRAIIQFQTSFLMLPIWTGLLVGIGGFAGLVIGCHNKRQGFTNVTAVSAIRAINTMCIGLSFLAFYMYGQVLSYLSLREAVIEAISNTGGPSETIRPPELLSPIHVYDHDHTRQGILSAIMCLCFAEMFIGGWLAFLEKDQMVFGSPQQQDRRPYSMLANEASQPYSQPIQRTVCVVSQVQQQPLPQ